MLDAKTTEKELLITNILDILKRYVDPPRLSEQNACQPEHPKKLRATDYADIIICAPIAFTEKGAAFRVSVRTYGIQQRIRTDSGSTQGKL